VVCLADGGGDANFGHGPPASGTTIGFKLGAANWGDTLQPPPAHLPDAVGGGIGFGISFVLAIIAFRFRSRPPLGAVTRLLLHPKHRSLPALVPATGDGHDARDTARRIHAVRALSILADLPPGA
jgi:hypothetical protein